MESYTTLNGSYGENITRGVLVYLPPNKDMYEKQLKSLYLSIAYMRTFQKSFIKTDLIVFTSNESLQFPYSLGCVNNVRKSFDDAERCIVIKHVPIKERGPLANGLFDPLVAIANQIEIISTLAEFKYSSSYDYLVRSDIDTFVTPGFSNWLPPKPTTVMIGFGGYGSLYADNHLKWVTTKKLKLNDTGNCNAIHRKLSPLACFGFIFCPFCTEECIINQQF